LSAFERCVRFIDFALTICDFPGALSLRPGCVEIALAFFQSLLRVGHFALAFAFQGRVRAIRVEPGKRGFETLDTARIAMRARVRNFLFDGRALGIAAIRLRHAKDRRCNRHQKNGFECAFHGKASWQEQEAQE
jgi:hypothetical protein